MVTLEQIKLLESKLARAINFVTQITEENNRLKKQNNELEKTINALKEEKTRVEEVIISALGKLNKFEDAIERSLGTAASASSVKSSPRPAQKATGDSPERNFGHAEPPRDSPVKTKPAVPSAYIIDENSDPADSTDLSEEDADPADPPDSIDLSEDLDEIEDSGEAELDIF
ncbi:MAG: cell division protein ZapB [Treponema sp.]|nr:cell division protein ZapB [Treponema sp.]